MSEHLCGAIGSQGGPRCVLHEGHRGVHSDGNTTWHGDIYGGTAGRSAGERMKPLYKTTIIIWSEYEGGAVEIQDLAREATEGDAYCSLQHSERVADPAADPNPPSAEFFEDGE